MPDEERKRAEEYSRPDWKRAFREGAEDVLHAPFGEPVYWFCPERFQLPLWPEFLLQIRWSRAESVTHYSSYVYALEFPLYGDLALVSRDREVVVTPGSAGIVHRGEYSMLKAGPSGFCSKLSIGLRGVILSSLFASCGLSDKLVVQRRKTLVRVVRLGGKELGAGVQDAAVVPVAQRGGQVVDLIEGDPVFDHPLVPAEQHLGKAEEQVDAAAVGPAVHLGHQL